MKKQIMSLLIDDVTVSEAVDTAVGRMKDGVGCSVMTPNAEIAYLAEKDEKLKNVLNRADLTLPDGVGVVKAASIIGTPLKGKAAGVDFAEKLCAALAENGKSLFLYGGKPGVAEQAAENLVKKNPGLKIAGTLDGYGDPDEAQAVINSSGADALFVCLGCPKQEYFIDERELSPLVRAGLGGSLDVFAGTAKRAPGIFIDLGLEWLYRLLKQPSRIGRMFKLPAYILKAYSYKLRRKKDA